MIGKHPSDVEAATYEIDKNVPMFISIKEDQDVSEEYNKYLRDMNNHVKSLFN